MDDRNRSAAAAQIRAARVAAGPKLEVRGFFDAPTFTAGTSALPGGDPAVPALEASAARGDAKSQFLLALRYAEGRGVAKDDVKAASLVTKAAQQGLTVAEYRLGAIYERGVGAPKDSKPTPSGCRIVAVVPTSPTNSEYAS